MDDGCQSSSTSKSSSGIQFSRNWFMSLSRRKKSTTNNTKNSSAIDFVEGSTTAARANSECDLKTQDKKPRKDDRNVFQKIKRKMEIRFPSRQQKVITNVNDDESSKQTTVEEPKQDQEGINTEVNKLLGDHYRNSVAKKWLEQESGPNLVMFKACTEMISHGWYWGEISRHDAQKQLTAKPNGSFLVRDSESGGLQFSLSFRIGNCTLHYRIQYHNNYWHFEELHYESIVELIEDIMLRSTDENFVCYVKVPSEMQPPFPVILKYPVSRYIKIPTLQDLCRRIIQQHIIPDKIGTLPIPIKLQEYLYEKSSLIF